MDSMNNKEELVAKNIEIKSPSISERFKQYVTSYAVDKLANWTSKYMMLKIKYDALKSLIHYNFGFCRIVIISFEMNEDLTNVIFIGILNTWFPIYSY